MGSFSNVVTSETLSTQQKPVSGSVTHPLKSTPPEMASSCLPCLPLLANLEEDGEPRKKSAAAAPIKMRRQVATCGGNISGSSPSTPSTPSQTQLNHRFQNYHKHLHKHNFSTLQPPTPPVPPVPPVPTLIVS